MHKHLEQAIFKIQTEEDFNRTALDVFAFQHKNIPVYRQYCSLRNIEPRSIVHYKEIPFLPISFFKSSKVINPNAKIEAEFTSSGTTGSIPSRHLVQSLNLYHQSFTKAFQQFYGDPSEYCILALLPSYLERTGSSLVVMADELIKGSKHPQSGFYLNNYTDLVSILKQNEAQKQKTLLLGVTYALLDLAELHPLQLKHTTVMETGGMKGRRKELIREEMHQILKQGLGIESIHSEYGMTELLSQAYSKGDGIFNYPNWMRILTRDTYDPYQIISNNRTGGINIIDLANIYSCSFIETQDLGKAHNNGSFEILGRFDQSDTRGCNLMVGA